MIRTSQYFHSSSPPALLGCRGITKAVLRTQRAALQICTAGPGPSRYCAQGSSSLPSAGLIPSQKAQMASAPELERARAGSTEGAVAAICSKGNAPSPCFRAGSPAAPRKPWLALILPCWASPSPEPRGAQELQGLSSAMNPDLGYCQHHQFVTDE